MINAAWVQRATAPLRSIAEQLRWERWRQSLRLHSRAILRTWLVQCECVAAQRVRRLHAASVLHWRLWGCVSRGFGGHKHPLFLIGATTLGLATLGEGGSGVTDEVAYSWGTRRISDADLHSHLDELAEISVLREKTMTCSKCHRRLVIDQAIPGVSYCTCEGGPFKANRTETDSGSNCGYLESGCPGKHRNWTPFLERPGVLIWRQEHPKNRGLYSYKVHGVYGEVTAADFLHVQTDIDYRRKWDSSAASLRVVETHPESNSDVIYWEMRWPRFLANRDYVFQRRYLVDYTRRIMVICNRTTTHPECPPVSGNHRVSEYWSVMVIRPIRNQDFHQPGIEFGLTYFDNPGLALPSAVTTWVAFTALPDFLSRLRWAAGQLAQHRADSKAKATEPKRQSHDVYA